MRKSYLILTAILFCSTTVRANNYIPINEKKSHLDFNLEKGVPHLKFYGSKDFKGKALIELNDQGLFINRTKKCEWPKGQFKKTESYNMVLKPISPTTTKANHAEIQDCKDTLPIISTWGGGGTGTAVLYIEIDSIDNDTLLSTSNGKLVYLNLKDLKSKYTLRKPGEISNKPGE